MSPKILIVGCGLTGAAVNRYITSLYPALKPSYTFWEKSSFLGGRMYSNYQPQSIPSEGKEMEFLSPHCDMGAQYLTRSSDDAELLIYSILKDAGVITPIIDNTVISGMRPEHLIKTHFVAPHGLSSVIDHLSKGSNSGAESKFCYDTTLQSIVVKQCDDTNSKVYSAVGLKSGVQVEDSFDTVILTLPTPQLLALEGDVKGMMGEQFREQLNAVVYSSRYAVAFYYPHSSWSALQSIPWSGRYVFDDDIIRYVSIENRKSGSSTAETTVNAQGESETNKDGGPSILVHTSVPFGIQHKNTDESEVYKMIQNHLDMVLPNLGSPVSHHMVNWRESQISKGLANFGYTEETKVMKTPDTDSQISGKRKIGSEEVSGIVVIAGDAFTESNFEGCLRSAKAAAVAIGENYKNPLDKFISLIG